MPYRMKCGNNEEPKIKFNSIYIYTVLLDEKRK